LTHDDSIWPLLALFAVIITGYVIYALTTGRVRSPNGPIFLQTRSKDPLGYWLGVVFYIFLAGICWYLAAKGLLDLGRPQT
jgi:hypothetical protein